MAIIAKEEEGTKFPPTPQGVHHAICYAVYDVGTQFNETFGKWQRKTVVCWELPNERIDIDKDGVVLSLPRGQFKVYTLSLHEKADLRKHLEGWRGKAFTSEELQGFDILKLLGVNCQLQIIHKVVGDKTYANIASVLPLQAGMEKLEPDNPIRSYAIDEVTAPEGMPEWISNMIANSREKNEKFEVEDGMSGDSLPPIDSYDDDIPF